MSDRYDYVALQWIKGEVGETLKKVRESIEAYAENPEQPFPLYLCRDHLHQIGGVLQLVRLGAGARLAAEMEHLVGALMEGQLRAQADVLEALMQGALELSVYLDQVQETRVDPGQRLWPVLDALRQARGERPLPRGDSAVSDPSHREPSSAGPAAVDDGLLLQLRKARQAFQVALAGFSRDQQEDLYRVQLIKVFELLERLCQGWPVAALWSATLALLEGAQNPEFAEASAVRALLRRVDQEFRRLLESPALLLQPVAEATLDSLLLCLAHSGQDTPRVLALKQRYPGGVATLEPGPALPASPATRGPGQDAMRSVVIALAEELARVTEGFDLFVRGGRNAPGALSALLAPLKQIADILAMVALERPCRSILEQRSIIQRWLETSEVPGDELLMEVAGALLRVEAELHQLAPPEEALQGDADRLTGISIQGVQQAVLKEAHKGLLQAKESLLAFTLLQWDHQYLQEVPGVLEQIAGGLAMVSLPRASDLLRACGHYIKGQLLAEGLVPDEPSLDRLADALSAVEYFLERLIEDPRAWDLRSLEGADALLADLVPAAPWLEKALPADSGGALSASEARLPSVVSGSGAGFSLQSLRVDPLPLESESVREAAPLAVEVSERLAEDAGSLVVVTEPWRVTAEVPSLDAVPPPTGTATWPGGEEAAVERVPDEVAALLSTLGQVMPRCLADLEDLQPLGVIRNAFYTLKGYAHRVHAEPLGDLAWAVENMLNRVLDGGIVGDARVSQVLVAASELIPQRVTEAAAIQIQRSDALVKLVALAHQLAAPEAQAPVAEGGGLAPGEEDDIRLLFLDEGEELLEAMESAIGRWSAAPGTSGPMADILRLLHTFKGAARAVGLADLGDMAHALETQLAQGLDRSGPDLEQALIDADAGYERLVEALRQLRAPDRASAPAQVQQPVTPRALELPYGSLPGETEAELEAGPPRDPEQIRIGAGLLEDIVNLAAETSIFRSRIEQQVASLTLSLGEMEVTIERARDQLRRLDTETQSQRMSCRQFECARADYGDFDPLEMDRYSQMHQLSRALFESASDLFDLRQTLAARLRDAQALLVQQGRVNTALQEGLMRTRMVPFERSVVRLRRVVRRLSKEVGKQVDLVVDNTEGDIDRTILERMTAPLEHMLRNAVDHGIETVEERVAAGKPPAGQIRLSLNREGGEVLLALSDDGRGIAVDTVRSKAIEQGLLDPGVQMTERQLLGFILESGLSTAEQLTQISGRGVGLDVVNAEVRKLGGTIEVDSTVGQGTRFLVRLPFSASVDRALMIKLGDDSYGVPLNTIEGVTRVAPQELGAFYSTSEQTYSYAGTDYEVVSLKELLGKGLDVPPDASSVPLILVRLGDRAVAVLADELAGSQEIVVKSLGPQFAAVPGLSGASFLGDGRVVVILDLRAAIRAQPPLAERRLQPRVPEPAKGRLLKVMVVDDSITVRKVTSRLLERNRMEPVTAKDGVEAIGLLQDIRPDLMLLDIEMPRMDGFEVAAHMRHNKHLESIPIIMITSRSGDKHRARAQALGVNDYLGKPYREEDLLAHIQRLTDQTLRA